VSAGYSALADLAGQLRPIRAPGAADWPEVDQLFQAWVRDADLRNLLKTHLGGLSGPAADAVAARSRETTTHFAWCLLDEPADPFSVWLHEYKPHGDWRPGYADSVHNHRYHFCTTILAGGYTHERYAVELNPAGDAISAAQLRTSRNCPAGAGGHLLADEFHRIPVAADGTMTVLVKSRAVRPWSLSYDPATGASQRHVPVEHRLDDLVRRL
jgi:hypothetical protein